MIIYLIRTSLNKENKKLIRDELLSFALLKEFNIKYSEIQINKNEYGKPYIKEYPNIHFNISHCNNLIACSIDNYVNGIDVENIREYDDYVANRICSLEELKNLLNTDNREKLFFCIWTLKESLGKALGVGLNYCLKGTTFIIKDHHVYCSNNIFKYQIYEIFENYLLAVSYKSKEDIRIKEVIIADGNINLL